MDKRKLTPEMIICRCCGGSLSHPEEHGWYDIKIYICKCGWSYDAQKYRDELRKALEASHALVSL